LLETSLLRDDVVKFLISQQSEMMLSQILSKVVLYE